MAKSPLHSPELLRQLLRYEPETGELFWLPRPQSYFKNGKGFGSWNARWAGRRADSKGAHGYRKVLIYDRPYVAHRIAWAIYHGAYPANQIDHINGDRSDNRLANLRDVPEIINRKNCAISSLNTSGATGVRFRKDRKARPWQAFIHTQNGVKMLGSFETFELAKEARRRANPLYGYHENHGRERTYSATPDVLRDSPH